MVFNSLGARTHTHTDFPDKSNFKKPGFGWHEPHLKMVRGEPD